METFQIQKETAQTADKHVKSEIGQLEGYGHKEKDCAKQQKIKEVARNSHPFISKTKEGAVKNIVQNAARATACNAHQKNINLIGVRHLNSL